MTGPPNSPMLMADFLEAANEPTSPLPQLPTPSSRAKRLARAERLQISPSSLAQIKNRSPGTPSPLNSNRPVSKKNALEGALSIVSPTARRAKDYNPQTPRQFALTQFSHEERKSDVDVDAPICGFSLQEFLQEDKQQENDELIDNILANVSSPNIGSPASPSSPRNDSSVKSKRPRGRGIRRRLTSLGQSKDEQSRSIRRKFDPKAVSKITPSNEPSPFSRFTSDDQFSAAKLFDDKRVHPVEGLVSVSDFLEQEAHAIPRPDSPTLGFEFPTVKRNQEDSAKPRQQEEDDVFTIRNSSFSNQRAQKGGPLAYKSPAPLRLPQRYTPNASPSLPDQSMAEDDFVASTVAALCSVSTTSPRHSNSTPSRSKTPRRCATTPLSMQRATSTASRSTACFSDASSSRPLLDRTNRDSIASTVGTQRRSLNSIIESKRSSLASIIESTRRSDSSLADADKNLSDPRTEGLEIHSVELASEATKNLVITSIEERRLSDTSVSTKASNTPPELPHISRRLTIKKMRKWSPFSSSFSPRSPLSSSGGRAFFPITRVVSPRSPPALVKVPGCSDEAHEIHKQRVAKRMPIAKPALLQLKFDHMKFNRGIIRKIGGERSIPRLTEGDKQINALATMLGWSDHLGFKWGEASEEKKAKCEELCRALQTHMKIAPRMPCPSNLTYKLQTSTDLESDPVGDLDSTRATRDSMDETEMFSFDTSRTTSKSASRSETPASQSIRSRARNVANQSFTSHAPMSPSLSMSRSTSSSELPLLTPFTSFNSPVTSAKCSFSSRPESRRPRAETIGPVNPFGSFVYWERPIETVEQKAQRKLDDSERKRENEVLEKEGGILSAELLQLKGKFRGMERYIAHDKVQRDLRKAYDKIDKAQVPAAEVARRHLDFLQPSYTCGFALDASDLLPDSDSNLLLGGEGACTLEQRARECADVTMVGGEGIRNYMLVWAQRFIDRCEQNGW
ncbi:hypothetical protein FKW77_003434 [Venturia effusa]|uniref:Uncharacterized protein n=1 Tax=Venturia effusa TaxID=50376 RepID=A0A517L2Y7_9PEZI|nr:hypothetical protein FKW77_003434 [Venturia effusa]